MKKRDSVRTSLRFPTGILSAGLIPAMISAFALMALPAFADSPKRSSSSQFSSVLKLNRAQTEALIQIKDHKGESLLDQIRAKESKPTGNEPGEWAHLDPKRDQTQGTSTQRVYENFRFPRSGNTVIVAVIDSGIDIRHPDLAGKIWNNEKELYGTAGVDDDQNGYIDDVFGWNFLGNPQGQNVDGTNLEMTREYARLKKLAEQGPLSTEDQAYFERVKADYEENRSDTEANLNAYRSIRDAYAVLKAAGLKEETVEAVQALSSTDETVQKAKALVLRFLPRGITSARAESVTQSLTEAMEFHFNTEFNSSAIVGDNPNDLYEKGYGNNNVMAGDASHGTHVAGIIAAIRNNRMGIDGQASAVKIMSIRAVPNGDERDKDVANAIRYAVDNGARVVNMSFGKSYVFNKKVVDEAVLYAESKGVLLVHAAGNDGKNTDSQENNFPNRRIKSQNDVLIQASNWIEVGASDKNNLSNQLPANFSNYGKYAIDVFAPGVGILSTVPGAKYAKFNGTSMASPEVAGVAALLLNKFPQASMSEIKDAILTTVNTYGELTTKQPGTGEIVRFSDLSITGGTVNAYQAMLKLMSNVGYLAL